MGEVALILLGVFFCLGGFAVSGVGLVALGQAGRRKGYRSPFLLTGLAALSIATPFVGLLIIGIPGRIPDETLVFGVVFLGLLTFALVLSGLVVWLLPRRPERAWLARAAPRFRSPR